MTQWMTGHIDCAEKCQIPPGIKLCRTPTPRHKWNDISRCPNCGDCFLMQPSGDEQHGRDAVKSAREDGK